MLSQEDIKKNVAQKAVEYIQDDMLLGVGTGSTIKYFIEYLAIVKNKISGAVSSSNSTTELLKKYNIPVLDLNFTGMLDIYIDGADEINSCLEMIKGGGGALTREKIIATCSKKMICIADNSKYVTKLGVKFPLPIEVIPMARSYVAREIIKIGGLPNFRNNYITDNGNVILDIHNLDINEPIKMENMLNKIEGVVCVGIFANRSADELLLGQNDGTVSIIN